MSDEEPQPYRNLIAAILQEAVDDCAHGKYEESASAYVWITSGWGCKAYCALLLRKRQRLAA